eukprot:scaffold15125_cov111-Isochrysis_galbana.AAC.3
MSFGTYGAQPRGDTNIPPPRSGSQRGTDRAGSTIFSLQERHFIAICRPAPFISSPKWRAKRSFNVRRSFSIYMGVELNDVNLPRCTPPHTPRQSSDFPRWGAQGGALHLEQRNGAIVLYFFTSNRYTWHKAQEHDKSATSNKSKHK